MGRKNIWLIVLLFIAAIAAVYWFLLRKKDVPDNYGNKQISSDSAATLWYKNAVIYTLDVETFQDSDDDGVGDFKGLTRRLGYIDSLGANTIWLQPFQPTPNKDDGYDVSDYTGIDRRYGSLEDFKTFIRAAKARGVHVLMDLVVNHTSNEHPWFREARRDSTSKYRSWYNWSKTRPKNADVGMVFPGVQKETWTYDSTAKEYYYHRFYNFQPDLNAQNTEVEAEILHIIKYWIDLGLDGFRLDAVPFVIEVVETEGEQFKHQFDMLIRIRAYLRSLNKDAIILGEANVLPDETIPFFGEKADGIQMMFNFYVNQHLFYALATGDIQPLKEALKETGNIPPASQWGQFLRNHDEVDLGRLSNKARNKVFEKFGPKKDMQLYDRGIRRRFAPMVGNNRKLLELANSILFALPSTPVVRYGDEIAMGDDLSLKERESVRTPMQWNDQPNAGFTGAKRAVKPVIDSGDFSYTKTNVALQEKDPGSFLAWNRQLINLRKQTIEIGFGEKHVLDPGNKNVLAIIYKWQGKTLLTLHNFSNTSEEVSLTRSLIDGSEMECLFPEKESLKLNTDNNSITLPPYGYRWYRVK